MPILKANEPLPERPVVICLYGEGGSCKTTLGNTANEPFVLDFDRGVSRSILRKDTLIVDGWEEVLAEDQKGTFKNYKTIVIDTAKAALDDFLMAWVVKQDFKLKKNKLQAYGAIGDEFKIFLSTCRSIGVDVIIIAHAKKDEDTKKIIPDVTGQSYQLILRVADQVGYVSFVNNERTIQWDPTDLTVGKNTASLPTMRIPDKSDPSLKTFMATVVEDVKKSIIQKSEAENEALAKSQQLQEQINTADNFDTLSMLLTVIAEQPSYLKVQLLQVLKEKALSIITDIKDVAVLNEALQLFLTKPLTLEKPVMDEINTVKTREGFVYDKDKKIFIAPPPANGKDELSGVIPGDSVLTEDKKEQPALFQN